MPLPHSVCNTEAAFELCDEVYMSVPRMGGCSGQWAKHVACGHEEEDV